MFVLDAETHECLHYESVIGYPPTKYAAIPREILEEHPEVEIRNDLIDCAIDVCSVEVSLSFCSLFPRLTCLLRFHRYFKTAGLFGSPASCMATIEKLKQYGVDEIACLIDFGVAADDVLASLPYLDELRRMARERRREPR